MKKFDKKTMILTTIICMLPMIFGLIVYDKIPDMVPTHWNVAGEIDGYSSKVFAVFGLPAFMTIISLFVQVAMATDPKDASSSHKMQMIGVWIAPILSVILVPICILVSMGHKIDVVMIVLLIIGILFVFVGNYLPKCRQNFTVGIRVPWTLNSEENWKKTHRFGGYVFVVAGLIMIVSGFFQLHLLAAIGITVAAVIPIVYSFVLYTKGI